MNAWMTSWKLFAVFLVGEQELEPGVTEDFSFGLELVTGSSVFLFPLCFTFYFTWQGQFFLREKEIELLNIKFVIGKKTIPYYLNEVTTPNVLWYIMSVISHSYSVLLFWIKEPVQEQVCIINAS